MLEEYVYLVGELALLMAGWLIYSSFAAREILPHRATS